MERRFKYLWDRQVVYRRDPISDIPDEETKEYMFFKKVHTSAMIYLEVKQRSQHGNHFIGT